MSRSSRVLALLVLFAITASACDDGRTPPPVDAAPSPSIVDTGPVAAVSVVTGDCLAGIVLGSAERSQISEAQKVSCHETHGIEVFATVGIRSRDFGLEDPDEYPGRARVVAAADAACVREIEELLADHGDFGLITLWPTRESWGTGDRTVACAVFRRDGAPFDRPVFNAPVSD